MRAQLADVLKRLQTGCRFVDAHPKWVVAEKLHVTLVFLGSVADHEVQQLTKIMEDVALAQAPFELHLDGLGFFPPDVREPKVLSAGIAGELKPLKLLYNDLVHALQAAGIQVQNRPYRPHLTLARLTSIKTSSRLASLVQSHSHMLNAKFQVDEVVLFESHASSAGSAYERIAQVSLAPAHGPVESQDNPGEPNGDI